MKRLFLTHEYSKWIFYGNSISLEFFGHSKIFQSYIE